MITHQSYKDWMHEVEINLKGVSKTTLEKEVLPGIVTEPFGHQEVMDISGPIFMPKAIHSVKIVPSGPSANRLALEALQLGAQSIEMEVSDTATLQEIHLPYITSILHTTTPTTLDQYLDETYLDESIPYLISSHPLASKSIGQLHKLHPSTKEEPLAQLKEIVQGVRSGTILQGVVQLTIGRNFLVEVARLRALRLVLHNLLDLNYGPLPIQILVRSEPNTTLQNNSHEGIIHQSCMALSAIIGGADIIQMDPWQTGTRDANRTSLHILNILDMEVHAGRFQDVASGSYTIEDLTIKIAREVIS